MARLMTARGARLDLLTPLVTAPSFEAGLERTLRRVVRWTGARAGLLVFRPPRGAPIRARVGPARLVPRLVTPLGSRRRPLGELALAGPAVKLSGAAVPATLGAELGAALGQAWRLVEAARRAAVGRELAERVASTRSLDDVLGAFVDGVARLVVFDSIAVSRVDPERGEFEVVDVMARALGVALGRDARLPLSGTLLERMLAKRAPLVVRDVTEPTVPEASRRIFGAAGFASALLVPLVARGGVVGAVTLAACRPGGFGDTDADVVADLARPLAAALEQRRLGDESVRRARETRALLEAGRAVTASLDVDRTIRVIMEQARSVLGVESCGLMTIDPATGELVSVASLDLPPAMVRQIRVRPGEGISGCALAERRPMQSADLYTDPRVRYPQLPRASGLRSMLAAPLHVGDRAVGVITVFRGDVHHFSAAEEELLVALADQAAIALEHARLYTALEAMVAERTRELDTQKRFVEVVLETLPLGVFVLDAELGVVRANRTGAQALGGEAEARGAFAGRLAPDRVDVVERFLRDVLRDRRVSSTEQDMIVAGETKVFRLTAAPLTPGGAGGSHVVLLVEDVTRAKRLEQQMLLTERLTTAGRLASGVAHELNNPLATIAGCAESLQGRVRDGGLARLPQLGDFPRYLALIEEEAYRCKEITASLLQLVREPGSRRGPTDLNALVRKTIELLSRQSRFAESRFETELDPALPAVDANEGQVRQVFLGLAANALEAMEGRGRLTIRTRARPAELEVEFEDEGPGIADHVLPRIFDPFFTTKPPGQGTGLGLAIAQGIVTDHGGRIEATSRPGAGSVFRVVLPR